VDEPVEAWGELPPGQRITWNQNQIRPDHYGIGTQESLVAIQAHWLVGPKRWISSKPVAVKVVVVPLSEWNVIFEDRWATEYNGWQSGTGYTVSIDGRLFLFFGSLMSRIAEVSPYDEFERRFDKDKTNMEITIKNPKGSRKLYYHLRQGLVRDKPWPVGPVSVLCPKPEPIPTEELNALRLKIKEK